jgi:hypothetical protein
MGIQVVWVVAHSELFFVFVKIPVVAEAVKCARGNSEKKTFMLSAMSS